MFDKKAYDREYGKRTGYASQKKYNIGTKSFTIRFRIGEDDDVINELSKYRNKTDYIRRLIKKDLLEK